MTDEENKKRVFKEEDYIKYPRTNDSLTRFLFKNPEGVKTPKFKKDGVQIIGNKNIPIGKMLLMSEEEVEKYYQEALKLLRNGMEESDEE